MGFVSILTMTRRLIAERVQPGDTVVDATVGNGKDTVFLAELTGANGTVYGFDIQQEALAATRQTLTDHHLQPQLEQGAIRLIEADHSRMDAHIPAERHGRIKAIMFNLGYLPGGTETTITRPETTVPALQTALRLIQPGGIVTVVVYPGHPGGQEEADAVVRWAGKLPTQQAQVMTYRFLNPVQPPPFLIAIEKR